jgi:hypothetical protein
LHKSPPPYLLKNLADYSKHLAATSHRRGTDAAISGRSDTNDTLVNGSLNAVVLLDVKLRQSVVLEGTGLTDITKSRGINNVSHRETLDSLVLGDGLGGRNTPKVTQEVIG